MSYTVVKEGFEKVANPTDITLTPLIAFKEVINRCVVGSWPDDFIAISDADHDTYSGGIPEYQKLTVNADGEMGYVDIDDVDTLLAKDILRKNTNIFNVLMATITRKIRLFRPVLQLAIHITQANPA